MLELEILFLCESQESQRNRNFTLQKIISRTSPSVMQLQWYGGNIYSWGDKPKTKYFTTTTQECYAATNREMTYFAKVFDTHITE
jgi:hypothetical protein